MSSSHGQKVTTDPATHNHPKNENPGVVTSDSLAAESIQGGGSFASNADSRGPSAQPSKSTTTNTTDTSNATRLDPAANAAARDAASQPNEAEFLSTVGKGKESGVGPTWNATVGDGAAASSNGGTAPGYASHPAPRTGANLQPKGKNLQEGGFDSGAPNASFTTDIGGKNDPGRVGLAKAEADNVPVAGGAGPRVGQISGGGQGFDKLGGDTSA